MVNSIRTRLTLWYLGVLTVVIVAFSLSVYFLLARRLLETTDKSLTEISQTVEADLRKEEADLALERQQLAAEQTKEPDEDEDEKRLPDGSEERLQTIEEAIAEELGDLRFRDSSVIVLDQNGHRVAASEANAMLGQNLNSLPEQSVFLDLPSENEQFRVHQKTIVLEDKKFRVFVVRSHREQIEFLDWLRRTFVITTPLALLFAGLAGYSLARHKLAPLVSMSEQAARIGSSNLDEKLPIKNERDELGVLARAFNKMLGRLEDSFDRQKQFMADASHELRTPLAIIRGESEVAISKQDRSADEYRESLSVVHDESRRLTKIVDDLFTLARADSGQLKPQFSTVFLDEILMECVHVAGSLARVRNIQIELSAPSEMKLNGDETLLHRLFLNLLDNSIKYNRPGGSVSIVAESVRDFHNVLVKDTGHGIAEDDRARIFERFYRADKARTRDNTNGKNGVGLGLSIAVWIAEIHNGSLILKESSPQGSAFEVRLPSSE